MDANTLLEGAKIALTVVFGGLALYFKYSAKAQAKAKVAQETISKVTADAVIFIKEAEEQYKDTTKAGGEKFKEVVNRLYGVVPQPLQGIITKKMVEEIVQSTFNEIEQYVQLQLDKAIENTDK